MTAPITGLWAACATPLEAGGGVDHAAFARHGARLLTAGCDGLVLFGTTGEGPSFTSAERLAAVAALLKAGIAPDRLALGTGGPAIGDTIALIRDALSLGLVHALILPPYYFRDAPPEGIGDAFAAVLDGVGDARLRATLYSIPQVSGVGVPPAQVARLRRGYGAMLAGVKDSSGDFAQFLAFRAAAPEVAVLVGNEPDIARARAAGGAGTICGMVNLAPALVRAMFASASAASAEAALRGAIALLEGHFIAAMKTALAEQTGEPNWRLTRLPLRPADAALGRRIAAGLEGLAIPAAA
jgi:4-hydroxy-tetrahydrodipicolinate synthase